MNACLGCGEPLEGMSPRAKYHGAACRKRVQRAGGQIVTLPSEPKDEAPTAGPIEQATYAELEAADKVNTSIGQTCLALARRLDRPGVDTGSAMATVAARLDDLRTKATRGAAASATQGYRDELAARRARHA